MKDLRKSVTLAAGILALSALLFSPVVASYDDDESDDSTGPASVQVYVVHGIPGVDLGTAPALPVDVLVNDSLCLLEGFTFGTIEGPYPLEAGIYNLKISLASSPSCSNDPVINADVTFLAGENASVVAYLDTAGGPTAGKFVNDVSKPGLAKARLIAQHTANAPVVDVKITRPQVPWSRPTVIEDFENGEQVQAELLAGQIAVRIVPANMMSPVFGPFTLNLRPYRAYLVYAVGSVGSGSFTLLTKEVMTEVSMPDDDDDEDDDRGRGWPRGGRWNR